MGECRAMYTPMITHWRKIDASKEKDLDPTLYRKLISSLTYLVNTRLDISYAVNSLSQFMVEPKRVYWTKTKHNRETYNHFLDVGSLLRDGFPSPSQNFSSSPFSFTI